MESLIRSLPKAELHVHLEGSMRPEVAAALARRHGIELPWTSTDGSRGVGAYACASFREFIPIYLALSNCLRTEDDLHTVIDDLAGRLVADNVRYAEVTFTPVTHLKRGVPEEVLIAGLMAGRARARTLGVEMRWVFDIVRLFPEQAQATLEFVRAVAARDVAAVVGLGLSGPETDTRPDRDIIAAFGEARADGFHSLPHAGEMAGPQSVAGAVLELGAERIGHGIRCLEDPRVVELLYQRKIPLEVCPTSNVVLGVVSAWAQHPLPKLLDAGLEVCIATDDPGIFSVGLVAELTRCAEVFGLDASRIAELVKASWRHAFIDDVTRQSYLRSVHELAAKG